jgi:ABC-type nickel/cobalt efflux system permease component RcnA
MLLLSVLERSLHTNKLRHKHLQSCIHAHTRAHTHTHTYTQCSCSCGAHNDEQRSTAADDEWAGGTRLGAVEGKKL